MLDFSDAQIEAIAQWMQQYSQVSTVSLLKLQQALGMPIVEMWLGLLLGGFELEQRGDFYATAEGIWLL